MPEPSAVSVVIASHGRELRLRWLLNALERQDLEEPWDAVVVHDYDDDVARRIIEAHPLAEAEKLTHRRIEPGTGSPAKQRNIGWRTVPGELIAFTDDDCRPEVDWLRQLLSVARSSPRAAVQGRTRPDPLEADILAAPHVRTLSIDPVGPYCQTCNMLYPRELLDQLAGFDESAISGEDVDLSLRTRSAGATIVAAPEAIVNHAIEAHSLLGIVRQNLKWHYLAYLVKRHPEFRRELKFGLFWDADHFRVTLALIGMSAYKRDRRFMLLALPYVCSAVGRRGGDPRSRALATLELPGQAIRQTAEVLGMLAGSVRHRTILL